MYLKVKYIQFDFFEKKFPIVPHTDVFTRFLPTDVLHKTFRHLLKIYEKKYIYPSIQYHRVFQRNLKY